jgi:hypothetical protein
MASVKKTKGGTALTGELEASLADEAEAGYHLERARPVCVGRPSLGRGTSPRLDLRVEPELAVALHARAREEHRSVSAIARDALRRYVAS